MLNNTQDLPIRAPRCHPCRQMRRPCAPDFTLGHDTADTALQNNINRWYDAAVGRWLSADPIGFNGNDANLYRYVNNNSIFNNDIWGFQSYPGNYSIEDIAKLGKEGMKEYVKKFILGRPDQGALLSQIYNALKKTNTKAWAEWKWAEKTLRLRKSSLGRGLLLWINIALILNDTASVADAAEISYDWRDGNINLKECRQCRCALYSTPVIVPSWWAIFAEVEYGRTSKISQWDSHGMLSRHDCASIEFDDITFDSESVRGYTIYDVLSYKCTWGGVL